MILVTGAAGKTGRAVVRALTAKKQPVRALVRRSEQEDLLKRLGAQDVIVGDMRDQAAMDEAARGVRAVYHIGPNMHPEEQAIGQVIIAAAQAAGVAQVVYHSVLHPQTEAMPHHWQKLRVEEALLAAGLAFTILQPAAYMQNVLAYRTPLVERGVYPVPYAAETRLSMVDLNDVAEVAALVLTEPGHSGATYALSGPDVLSQTETAALLAQHLGRAVRIEVIPLALWKKQAREAGLDAYAVETLAKMFQYYEQHGFWGNPRVLGWLLERSPTPFAAFLERIGEGADFGF